MNGPRVFAGIAGATTALLASCMSSGSSRSPVIVAGELPSDRWAYAVGRYNRLYGDANQRIFVEQPSQFLVHCLGSLRANPGGWAVDLGAGQGRNTFAVAAAGYAVSAIDVSTVGLERIRKVARDRGLRVETINADVNAVQFRPESVRIAVAVFFDVSPELAAKLKDAVERGGIVVVEGFPSQCQLTLLSSAFMDWEILKAETVETVPDWYWGTDSKATRVSRFCARKPGSL